MNLSRTVRLLLALASGVALALAYPFFNLPILGWIAPALLIVSVLGTRPRFAFLLGWVHGIAYYGLSLPWFYTVMRQYGPLPIVPAAGVFALVILVTSLFRARIYGGDCLPRKVRAGSGVPGGANCVGRHGIRAGAFARHWVSVEPAGVRGGGKSGAGSDHHADGYFRPVIAGRCLQRAGRLGCASLFDAMQNGIEGAGWSDRGACACGSLRTAICAAGSGGSRGAPGANEFPRFQWLPVGLDASSRGGNGSARSDQHRRRAKVSGDRGVAGGAGAIFVAGCEFSGACAAYRSWSEAGFSSGCDRLQAAGQRTKRSE